MLQTSNSRLVDIIEYLDQGGVDIVTIRSKVMDGLYESRI